MGMEVDGDSHTLPYKPRKKREQGLTLAPGEIEIIFKPHTDVAEKLVRIHSVNMVYNMKMIIFRLVSLETRS